MPAGNVTVHDQKHLAAVVDDDRAHAERHPTGKAPIEMQHPSGDGLEAMAKGIEIHGQIRAAPHIGSILIWTNPACGRRADRKHQGKPMKRFAELSEQEVLALAIANEDEDNRIYRSFADALREAYPDTAAMYDKMAQEEIGHHDLLLDLYRKKFGDFLPLIRRQNVKGFVERRPIWLNRPLAIDATRKFAEEMEPEPARFYRRAAETAKDGAVRELLTKLAAEEDKHEELAQELGNKISPKARASEDQTAKRLFMLQYIQPGLAGLMDGSVSTLAPLFAPAFAPHQNWQTFLVGLAASIGAGISMGFAEALSDDGSLTRRGSARLRGLTCGIMTTLGGLGHALPYLVPDNWSNAFWIATSLAGVVVFFELWAIAYIRMRYMDTPFLQAAFQIVLGGAIVLGVGILIGAA